MEIYKTKYFHIRAEKGRHDIHAELNNSRAATDQVSREKVSISKKSRECSYVSVVFFFPPPYVFLFLFLSLNFQNYFVVCPSEWFQFEWFDRPAGGAFFCGFVFPSSLFSLCLTNFRPIRRYDRDRLFIYFPPPLPSPKSWTPIVNQKFTSVWTNIRVEKDKVQYFSELNDMRASVDQLSNEKVRLVHSKRDEISN